MLVGLLISGHAAGLQLVAWSGMFLDRLPSSPSAIAALWSAVDGTQPCALCRAVVQMQDQEQNLPDAVMKSVKKPESAGASWLPFIVLPTQRDASFTLSAGERRFSASDPADIEPPPPRG